MTQTYMFDDNGNLLATGVMTNSFDAANRLVSSSREGMTVEPIYNGVGDRVGQTIGATTTHFALDVQGLPEVIYTSAGNAYLHLPGVIVAESSTGETRYLLGDGLGSIRQAVDETGAVVAYNEFDPWGNPVQNTRGGEPYGYTGEWYENYIELLHLRARWYAPASGTFLSRDVVESEPPYGYVRGNPINQTDPSGLYPPELIERSVLSAATLNTLKTTRKGLYKLLLDAENGDYVDVLRPYIDPFEPIIPPYRWLIAGYLNCEDSFDGRIMVDDGPLSSRPFRKASLDLFIHRIELGMKFNPHPLNKTTQWAKESDSHYYQRSTDLSGGEFYYYSDFAGQDSPLPDVVAHSATYGVLGYTELVDKFGRGYKSLNLAASAGVPGSLKLMDGYAYPPSLGNSAERLQEAILGWGYSFEADLIIGGNGISFPVPEYGRSFNWDTRGIAPFGIGGSIGNTERRPELDSHPWDYLDEPVPSGAVARKPDNGCNCGE